MCRVIKVTIPTYICISCYLRSWELILFATVHRTPQCEGNCFLVCTIRGKHSHFCIGRAQSMHCAMMQHMTAVGHRHVCPTLTNTRLVNPPIKRNVDYPFGFLAKKVVFLPTEPTIRRGCLLSFRLALCYCLRSRSQ